MPIERAEPVLSGFVKCQVEGAVFSIADINAEKERIRWKLSPPHPSPFAPHLSTKAKKSVGLGCRHEVSIPIDKHFAQRWIEGWMKLCNNFIKH